MGLWYSVLAGTGRGDWGSTAYNAVVSVVSIILKKPSRKRVESRVPKRSGPRPPNAYLAPVLREGALLVFAALAVYLLVALATYHPQDPSWSYTGEGGPHNSAGQVGAWLADLLFLTLGYLAYLVPFMLAYHGWMIYSQKRSKVSHEEQSRWRVLATRWGGFVLTLLGAGALAAIYVDASLPQGSGGVLGREMAAAFVQAFSDVGASVLLLALLFSGVTLWTGFSWLRAMDATGRVAWELGQRAYRLGHRLEEWWRGRASRAQARTKAAPMRRPRKKQTRIEPVVRVEVDSKRKERENQIPLFGARSSKELPPLNLLDSSSEEVPGYSEETLTNMSQLIEYKLDEFGIEVKVVRVSRGPVVTRFDLEPAAGVRGQSISNSAKDLARSLSVARVRVVEVAEGSSAIGLEVPNTDIEMVLINEILGSQAFNRSPSQLTLALGKSVSGKPVICDLAQMPHLLLAGTTGSGKSVAVNAMILSLLYKALPEDLRLILIDPKMLELVVYKDIPHLLTPVVTDMNQAYNALRWCVREMDRRYALMSKLGVRNLAGYNRKISDGIRDKTPVLDPTLKAIEGEEGTEAPALEKLPFVVVVIDEFADLMMQVGRKVEDQIIRLAQKARAAGIHLLIATQRPQRDVLTGLIKSNISARVAFNVVSNTDSRVILDQGGAEQLLGNGDMLFIEPGQSLPRRVHGAFVSEDEVCKVVEHLKQAGPPDYLLDVTEEWVDQEVLLNGGEEASGKEDPLYQKAVDIVVRDQKASISYLQRRLKIGYNRSARLIEEMEVAGVVGAAQSSGAREILQALPYED